MTGEDRQAPEISSRALTARLLILAVAMFGFGFLLVPLYDVFCEITGFGGRTNAAPATEVATEIDPSRSINLEFVTTVNQYAPWEFEAELDGMTILFFEPGIHARRTQGNAGPLRRRFRPSGLHRHDYPFLYLFRYRPGDGRLTRDGAPRQRRTLDTGTDHGRRSLLPTGPSSARQACFS